MILGLTGGIGSGKSTVSKYIHDHYGFDVIDADIVAREIVEPGSPILDEIASVFGGRFILPDGNLDRKALGKEVFSRPDGKEKLDGIMMGAILDRIRHAVDNAEGDLLVDAALLFEEDIDKMVDRTILVDADPESRVRRVCERDGISETDVMNRISNQMSSEEKRALADIVIDNDGTLEDLYQKVDNVFETMI